MEPLLNVKGLSQNFGGLRALDEVDLTIDDGQIVALIGPNGAGKTTFFNCVTGIYDPTEGDVLICPPDGKPLRVNGYKTNLITELGMARTFQNIRLFKNMTVLENVMIGTHCRSNSGVLGALFRGPKTRKEEKEVIRKSYGLLKKVGLAHLAQDKAKNLPYGAQRKLEIARALATDPFILLLDEPAAGMNPQETEELKELVLQIRKDYSIAILLIEHDMKMVMSISDKVLVMEYGKKISEGTPEQVSQDPRVIKAYLGEELDA